METTPILWAFGRTASTSTVPFINTKLCQIHHANNANSKGADEKHRRVSKKKNMLNELMVARRQSTVTYIRVFKILKNKGVL